MINSPMEKKEASFLAFKKPKTLTCKCRGLFNFYKNKASEIDKPYLSKKTKHVSFRWNFIVDRGLF